MTTTIHAPMTHERREPRGTRLNLGMPMTRIRFSWTQMREVEPVQTHLEHLRSLSMTDAMIARAAGVSDRTVTRIREGLTVNVSKEVADALLSTTPRPHRQQALVLAYGARRRIEALAVAAHSAGTIAGAMGLNGTRIAAIRRATRISWDVHQAVDAAFQVLRKAPGHDAIAREYALRHGYRSAADWIDIDDFYEIPGKPALRVGSRGGEAAIERCRRDDIDPEVFFSGDETDRATAKRLCGQCPVRERCLDTALLRLEPEGIWGGATVKERREILRARQITLPKVLDFASRRRMEIVAAAVEAGMGAPELARRLSCSIDAAQHTLNRHRSGSAATREAAA
jgi:hypothetical protein